ncbi:MAG: apolipoprotein N-acyltransferase [Candidatus Binataceae bacterium]
MSLFGNPSGRAALAVASGLALALAFPKFDLSLLAWVAFVPLLYVVEERPLKGVFGYGFLQGLAFFAASLYWITITLHNFAGVQTALAVIPMLLLAAVMAVYTAVALWVSVFVSRRLRLPIFVTFPIAWAAVEWIRTYFPIGFPWNLLGYAAYRSLDLIQFAEFTGVYGISALIIFFNAVIYVVLFQRHTHRAQTWSLGALTALMLAAIIFGRFRMAELKRVPTDGSLKIAMVQGDIPQSIKWNPQFLVTSFKIYADQSRTAAKQGADLIVWPEAAAAFLFQPTNHYPVQFASDAGYRARLLELAADIHKPILFGAPALGVEDGDLGFYNRAYLVSGKGKVEGWYDKIRLVPFGEYVPLRSVFGYFVNRVVKGFGDMFPGRVQTIFHVKGARLGVLICYESIFPNLARKAVKRGADILLNITNDAWYGESSAPYQLLAMSAMRSVETKVPTVRVANTGISAVIEPDGQITATTPLFKRGTEIEQVSWWPERTVYTQVGDLFAEICLILTCAALLGAFLGPRKQKPLAARVSRFLSANGTR